MIRRIFVAAAVTLVASSAQAQYGCPPTVATAPIASSPAAWKQNATHSACVQAGDVYQLMAPQLGVSLTGGNTTLGQGGTLGGLGHFQVSVRGNIVAGDIPEVGDFPTPDTTQTQPSRELATKKQLLGLPVVDAGIGIFKGIPLGVTNVGGVDLLLSATYLPSIGGEGDDFQLNPHTNLKIGYGARIGLLQESILAPGISASIIRRELPTLDVTTLSGADTVAIRDLSVKTTSWRLVASKSLLLFGLAIGAGQDRYDQSASAFASVDGGSTVGRVRATVSPEQKLTRTNYFADLSLNLLLFKLVGEVGQVSGGDVATYNSFSGGAADKSRLYGSVGLRFGF